ncbi:twin-arginine translocation signal domain-containing protein, partial [Klebsiella pneumoniae]
MRAFSRRRFLQMAGASAVAAAVPGLTEAEELWSSGSATPTFKLPAGAVD